MTAKDGRFYLRLTDEDRALFDEVARALGSSTTSEAIRFLMRREHRELFGVPAAPSRATAKRRKKK